MKRYLLIFLLLAPLQSGANYNPLHFYAHAKKVYFENANFETGTLKNYLFFCGVSNVEIVLKQSKLETSHYKSNIFKKHNNLFGMKYATKRQTTAKGFIYADFGKVAKYDTWQASAQDYAIWQGIQSAKFSTKNYYAFLELSGYATNKRYNEILKGIRQCQKKQFKH